MSSSTVQQLKSKVRELENVIELSSWACFRLTRDQGFQVKALVTDYMDEDLGLSIYVAVEGEPDGPIAYASLSVYGDEILTLVSYTQKDRTCHVESFPGTQQGAIDAARDLAEKVKAK